MELEITLVLVVVIGGGLMLFLLYGMFAGLIGDRKANRARKGYLKKSMQEEYFTDPVTGRKFTLEEATQGIDMGTEQIRPESEIIAQFFDENDRELALMKNDLLKAGYFSRQEIEAKQPEYLYGESGYTGVEAILSKNHQIAVLIVSVHLPFQRDIIIEKKLVVLFETRSFMGHALVWETDMLARLGELLAGKPRRSPKGRYTSHIFNTTAARRNVSVIDHMTGMIEQVVEILLEEFDRFPGYECEITDQFIYIKASRTASRSVLQDLLKLENQLAERLKPYL